MNIIHTSDWHLGHHLHDHARELEHRAFLDWLLDQLDLHQVDALVVSGDLYDHANPASSSQRMLYAFLAQLQRRRPAHFRTVLVGGNHDSAIRLDAPIPLLDAMGVHVVGGLPLEHAEVDDQRLLVPLCGPSGQVEAWVGAMPYLRQSDLPAVPEELGDPLVLGVRQRYEALWQAMRARAEPHQALIATGHCYMVGSTLSEMSERRILGGNQHALPADLFPDWLAYGALGHLHKAQKVAGREFLRYSGSPIPLSFAEEHYRHQVLLVRFEGAQATEVVPLMVPRTVEMLRIGPAPIEELEPLLRQLPPLAATTTEAQRPFLEVRVRCVQPEPATRRRVEAALEGRAARLLSIKTVRETATTAASGDEKATSLRELKPQEVFERCYRASYNLPPSAELVQAFEELLVSVEEAP